MTSVERQKIAWLESLLDTTIGCYEDHRQELEKVRRELARHGANGKCVHLGPQRAGQLVDEIDVVLARSALRLEDFDPRRDYTNAKDGAASRGGLVAAPSAARAARGSAGTPVAQPSQAIPVRQGFTNPRASAGVVSGSSIDTPPRQTSPPQRQPPAAVAEPRGTAPHPMNFSRDPTSGSATSSNAPPHAEPRKESNERDANPHRAPAQAPPPPAQPRRAVPTESAGARPPQAPTSAAAAAAPAQSGRSSRNAVPLGAGPKQPSIQADTEYVDDDGDSISDYYEEIQQRYADAEEYEPGEFNPYPSHPPQANMDSRHLQPPPARPSQGRRNDPYEPLLTPPYVMPPAEPNFTSRAAEKADGAAHAPVAHGQAAPSGSTAHYVREPSTATSHNPPPSDSYVTTSNRPHGINGPHDATAAGAHPSASRAAAAGQPADACSSRAGMDGDDEDGEPQVIAVGEASEGDDAVNYSNLNADGLNDDRPNEPRPEFETLDEHDQRPLRDSETVRPRGQQRPLRTAEFRRHSPAFNNSHKVQDKVFGRRMDPAPRPVVEDAPAVEAFMSSENQALERAKAQELERLRKSFRPEQMLAAGSPMRRAVETGALVTVADAKSGALVLAKAPPPPPDTATEDQLKRERAVLNIQMERLEREFDKAVRMHRESGSEMRYQQLHNRMNRVKRDMERVDRELAEVQRLEK